MRETELTFATRRKEKERKKRVELDLPPFGSSGFRASSGYEGENVSDMRMEREAREPCTHSLGESMRHGKVFLEEKKGGDGGRRRGRDFEVSFLFSFL